MKFLYFFQFIHLLRQGQLFLITQLAPYFPSGVQQMICRVHSLMFEEFMFLFLQGSVKLVEFIMAKEKGMKTNLTSI